MSRPSRSSSAEQAIQVLAAKPHAHVDLLAHVIGLDPRDHVVQIANGGVSDGAAFYNNDERKLSIGDGQGVAGRHRGDEMLDGLPPGQDLKVHANWARAAPVRRSPSRSVDRQRATSGRRVGVAQPLRAEAKIALLETSSDSTTASTTKRVGKVLDRVVRTSRQASRLRLAELARCAPARRDLPDALRTVHGVVVEILHADHRISRCARRPRRFTGPHGAEADDADHGEVERCCGALLVVARIRPRSSVARLPGCR